VSNRRIAPDVLVACAAAAAAFVGYGMLVHGLPLADVGEALGVRSLAAAGAVGGVVFLLRRGRGHYLFRLGAVVVVAAAAILCLDNFGLVTEQEAARTRFEQLGPSATGVETAQVILVVTGRDRAGELDQIDWRRRPDPFSRWHLLAGAVAGGVLFLAWRHVVGRWWLVFVLAAILTGGLFAAVNNILVRGGGINVSEGDPASTYRERYVRLFGADPAGGVAVEDAKAFVVYHPELKPELVGSLLDLKKAADGKYDPVAVVTAVTGMTDARLISLLEEKLGVASRQWPRPANKHLGYNDLSSAVITRREWSPLVSAAPSDELLRRMVMTAAPGEVVQAKGKDGKGARIEAENVPGLALYTLLLRARMESLTTSTPLAVARRVNGIIQWVTAFTFFLGALALMARRYVHTERPRQTADHLLGPPGVTTGLPHESVVALWRELDERRTATGFGDATEEMLHDGCQTLVQTGDRVAAKAAVEAAQGRVADRADSEFALINYCIWLIPALGFVGTVMGISDAVFEARLLGEGDVMTGLARTMASLGVAFDTTFFALLGSIVLLFASLRIRREEERMLAGLQSEVMNRVVYAYVPPPASRARPRRSRRLLRDLRKLVEQQGELLRALAAERARPAAGAGGTTTQSANGASP
jgi:biopolymer transport protein ExbB/TolQ